MTPPVVEVRGSLQRWPRQIFDGLDLAVRQAGITAVMGPSCTGKTTLLRLLTGQVRPDAAPCRCSATT